MVKENWFMPRVRLDPEADQDILNWLSQLDYGTKSRAIKKALRRGLAEMLGKTNGVTAIAPMNHDELLAQMRGVFDASLESALSGLQLSQDSHKDVSSDSTEGMLDEFAGLMMLD